MKFNCFTLIFLTFFVKLHNRLINVAESVTIINGGRRSLDNVRTVFLQYLQPHNPIPLKVDFIESNVKGYCLVSKTFVKAGDTLLNDIPVVSWCYDSRNRRCSHCHTQTFRVPVCCKKCNEKYCSPVCRAKASFYHKSLCSIDNVSANVNVPVFKDIEQIALSKYSKNREDGIICLIMRILAISSNLGLENPLDIPGISILESKVGSFNVPLERKITDDSNIPRLIGNIDKLFHEKLDTL